MSTKGMISHKLKVACLIILLLVSIHHLGIADSVNDEETTEASIDCDVESEKSRQSYDTDDVKAAIEKGLEYLNDTKEPDGGWGAWGNWYGKNCNMIGICLRAFLGYNATDPRWQDAINGAVRFLKETWHEPLDFPPGQERDFYGGGIWNDKFPPCELYCGKMYSHGAATQALVDYYFNTRDISILPYINSAVELMVRAQNTPYKPATLRGPRTDGGWRYDPRYTSSDTSVTVWNLHALVLAESMGMYGIPNRTFEYTLKWFERAYSGDGFGYIGPSTRDTTTACGLSCLYLMGREELDMAKKAKETVLDWGPTHSISKNYYTYYATLAMYLAGGDEWKEWKGELMTALIQRQNQDGSWNGEYGIIWGTGMAIMMLNLCLDRPNKLLLESREDPDTGIPDETVKTVKPEDTESFNLTVSLKPSILELPLPRPDYEKKRVNITISESEPGWKVDLNTPAPDDGIIQPDGTRLWWAYTAILDSESISLNITAPRTGKWNEMCSITIHVSSFDNRTIIRNELTVCAILDMTVDFSIAITGEIDEFLGVKTFTINPGETIELSVDLRNLGDVNDTYHMWLTTHNYWNIQFEGGGIEKYISLSSPGYLNNSTSLVIKITAPDFAWEGATKNIVIFAESRFSKDSGIGLDLKSDVATLVVLDSPLQLHCAETTRYVRAGGSIDYAIEVRNNFHSDLLINLSVFSMEMMVLSIDPYEKVWSCGFLNNTCLVPANGTANITIRINAPDNEKAKYFRDIQVHASSSNKTLLEYTTEPLTIRSIVNDVPVVLLWAPENNSILIENRVSLNWSSRDLDNELEDIGYDLYFGKNPQPALYMANVSGWSMSMEGLDDNTKYYWYVIPHDPTGEGICIDGIWDFEVNTRLYEVRTTLISPKDNSILRESKATLTWEGFDPKGETVVFLYKVFLGSSPEDLELIASTTSQSMEVSRLEHGKTYYWKIIPVGISSEGNCSSGIWSFSIDQSGIRQFIVTSDIVNVSIPQGESKIFNITIENLMEIPFTVYLSKSGNISDYLDIPLTAGVGILSRTTVKTIVAIPKNYTIGNYTITITANNSLFSESLPIAVQVVEETRETTEDDNEEEKEDAGQTASWVYFLPSVLVIIIFCMFLVFRKRGEEWWKKRSRKLKVDIEYVPDHTKTNHPITTDDWGDLKPKAPIHTGEETKRRVIRVRVVRRARRLKISDNNPVKLDRNATGHLEFRLPELPP